MKKRTLFVVVGIISVLLLSCGLMWARRESREARIVRALHDVGVAIHNRRTSGVEQWLPLNAAQGKSDDSWRFALLPYLEHARSDAFQSSWDSGPYAHVRHPTYCLNGSQNGDGFYTTNILAIVGPGTLAVSPPSLYVEEAILLIAVGNTQIPWGIVGDLQVDASGKHIGAWPEPIFGDWIGICFADGRSWLIDKTVPPEKLSLFFTVEGAQEHRADDILGPYKVRGENFGD